MSGAGDLERIAAELYAGSPDDFIAKRNTRAKDAGDPTLSAAIRTLRKPTVAAWVVNLLARERTARLGQALQLAAELREAQDDLDAATLSQLGRQRRALTSQLAAEAASLATAQGARVTGTTLEAVRQTISAAFFDPDAAAAVASGRLLCDIEPTGSLDVDAVVGGPRPHPPVVTQPARDEVGAKRERRHAERALRDAEKARDAAARAAARAEDDDRHAEERVDRLTQRIVELETELQRTRVDAAQAQKAASATADRRRRAATERASAAEAADRAQHALDLL